MAALQDEGVLPQHRIVRTNRYLNNVVEQDHRRIQQRERPMLGFKHFATAAVTRTGIELMHKMRKGQFAFSGIGRGAVAAWEPVLTA